ncbi:MAG: hypothetical protein QOH88_3360 [Verrucomicrobiota bacterium]|jgi:hypothetical protein
MKSKFRSLLALFIFTSLALAGARPSADGKVKFPYDTPTFTVEFPAGWTYKADKDGNLDCDPGDNSGYTMSILLLPGIHSVNELKAALPKLANSMAGGAKLTDFELGDVETDTNGNNVRFAGIRGDGKVQGIDFVVVVHGFETKKGNFYAIVTAGTKKADKQHDKDYDSITASIEPL